MVCFKAAFYANLIQKENEQDQAHVCQDTYFESFSNISNNNNALLSTCKS